jgi:hypothetical protein
MAEGQPGEFEPVYLTLADVLELHALIIDATATEAADQLRNRTGLESALARPETYAHYQDADLALQAAVLAPGRHRRPWPSSWPQRCAASDRAWYRFRSV